MTHGYFTVLVRVMILGFLVTSLALLSRPQVALAAGPSKCLEQCAALVSQCEAKCAAEGLGNCAEVCSLTWDTCLEQCVP